MTTHQNSPEWFLLRTFSITSSAADGLIDELYKDYQCLRLPDTLSSNAKRIFRYLCDNIGGTLSSDEEEEVMENDDASSSNGSSHESTHDDVDGEFDINAVARNISSWNRGKSSDSMEDLLQDEGAIRIVDNNVLVQYVREMGGSPKATKAGNRGLILEWLKASPRARPYVFMTVKDMKELLVERGGRSRSSCNAMSKVELIRQLAGDLDVGHPIERIELWKRLLGRVLKATLCLNLSGKEKSMPKSGTS